MDLGRVGIWTFQLDAQPAARAQELAAEIEALGYGALWVPETAGRDSLVNASLLLGGTTTLSVATGIAGIYARDPLAMACGHKTLTEAYPDRFVLGLGVSHAPAVEGLRGHTYGPPLTAMREYLDAMDAAPYLAIAPTTEPVRVLAALGPKMLELARDRAAGAHPYFVPVEHTAFAREHLGPDALLAPEQKVVLETDPEKARFIARRAMKGYLTLPNYVNNLRRLGWGDDDFADGASDKLVDAIVVWGDEAAIKTRIDEHHAAGANHVCIQVLPEDFFGVPLEAWRRLAPALL
jgi:probable F420-dependent oxidoreductase, MSMEG_4141 family